ncbi:MAG TPA: hypothetical protein VKU60_05230 [Chloroflexota bacterium]|nr:hypothetical protein [Chloroflexota bacterium]
MIFAKKRGGILLAVAAAAAAPLLLASAGTAAAQTNAPTYPLPPGFPSITQVIYDSTSANVTASQGFQCCGTSEFGDAVDFHPGLRHLSQVTVELDDWAVYSNPATIPAGYTAVTAWKGKPTGAWPGGGTNPNGTTYSNPSGFYWPLTLNLYTLTKAQLSGINKPGVYPAAGTKIASVTKTVFIPWQPTPSTSSKCLSYDTEYFSPYLQAWKSPSGCEFGGPADITFDIPGGVQVPNGVVWGVAFDTESWGSNPVGYDGPFDSLNVAVTKSVRIGKDANPDGAFLDSTEAAEYGSCTGVSTGCPVGTFRNDPSGWTGYVPAAKFTASLPLPIP